MAKETMTIETAKKIYKAFGPNSMVSEAAGGAIGAVDGLLNDYNGDRKIKTVKDFIDELFLDETDNFVDLSRDLDDTDPRIRGMQKKLEQMAKRLTKAGYPTTVPEDVYVRDI